LFTLTVADFLFLKIFNMQLNNRDIEWCQRRCNYDQCVFSLRSTQYRLQLGYLFNL